MAAATAKPLTSRLDKHAYVFGIDWGRFQDFTVISVMDVNTLEQVYIERFNQLDYHTQVGRLRILYEKFKPVAILAEQNAIGHAFLEMIAAISLPIFGWTATNQSKAAMVDALSTAFERGQVRILNYEPQIFELMAFTAERLPGGIVRYAAPAGQHDDCVVALGLSYLAAAAATVSRPAIRDFRVVA
jgi:hypothetical protein